MHLRMEASQKVLYLRVRLQDGKVPTHMDVQSL